MHAYIFILFLSPVKRRMGTFPKYELLKVQYLLKLKWDGIYHIHYIYIKPISAIFFTKYAMHGPNVICS